MQQETSATAETEPPARRASTGGGMKGRRGNGNAVRTAGAVLPGGAASFSPRLWSTASFCVGDRSAAFRSRFFPGTSDSQWNDWHWQLRNSIGHIDELAGIMRLSEDERTALASGAAGMPFRITPYYAGLLSADNPCDPLRRTVVPVGAEAVLSPGEQEDPLAEEPHTPVPGVVHRYPDRVLFLVSDSCAVYCRYCTRSRMVGRQSCGNGEILNRWEAGIEYIASNRRIRDVLISGGDPLLLSDDRLEGLLARLRAIDHLEILRIGSKAPVVLPQRVTPALARMLGRFQPLWMNLHFTHPDELTDEVKQACGRLAGAGIPLQSQTVLLAGINDAAPTLMSLFHGLLRMRVRPYYLFQCDPVAGSGHFRTPLSRGLAVMQALRGHTTGFAIPLYVIDTPGSGGKIPIMPECVMGQDGEAVLLTSLNGTACRCRDDAGLSRALIPE